MNPLISRKPCLLIAVLLGLANVFACGPGLYDLPTPPPQAQWTSVSLTPGAEEQRAAKNFLEASAIAMDLFSAFSDENWEDAWALLSEETKSTLNYGNPDGDGINVLKTGQFELAGETGKSTFRLEPVRHFFVEELMRFEDEVAGNPESETNRRKEIYALSRSGDNKKVVLIYEAGGWKVHKTTFGELSAAPN